MEQVFFDELEELYASKKEAQIERYLQDKYAEAVENKNEEDQIIIINKQIEYYVSVRKNEIVTKLCEEVQEKISEAGLRSTEVEADTVLNMAKVYTELGRYDDAMQLFAQAMPLYTTVYGKMDTHTAELYVALSELFKKNNAYDKASQALFSAIDILSVKWNARIECAIARVKLASCYVQMDELNKADFQIDNAIAIYEEDEDRDIHYSDALAVLGQLRFKQKRFTEAALYTHQAMDEIREKVGKTETFYQLDKILQQMQPFCKTPLKVKPEPEPEPEIIVEEITEEIEEKQEEMIAENIVEEEPDENEEIEEQTDAVLEESVSDSEEISFISEEIPSTSLEETTSVEEISSVVGDMEAQVLEKTTLVKEEIFSAPQNNIEEEAFSKHEETKAEPHVITAMPETMETVGTDEVIEQSRNFYETMAAPLFQAVPEWKGKFAIGIAGEALLQAGEKPGFCIWLSEEESAQYSEVVSQIYEALQKQNGIASNEDTGVMKVSDFYQKLIGTAKVPFSEEVWQTIPEENLYLATNGAVFVDHAGEFSKIRNYLEGYYPENIRKKKIAALLEEMANSGQKLYERSIKRQDEFMADIQLATFAKQTLQLLYILNKQYAPTEDMLYMEAAKLKELSDVRVLLSQMQKVSGHTDKAQIRNAMIKRIVDTLKAQELTVSDEFSLQIQAKCVLDSIVDPHKAKEDAIIRILNLEEQCHAQLQGENNANDRKEAIRLRKSLLETWTMDMLKCWEKDLLVSNKENRNLISERYIRMMKSTSPIQYKYIESLLPPISERKAMLIDQILVLMEEWIQESQKQDSNTIEMLEKLYAEKQSFENISFIDGMRAELETYSEELIDLYLGFLQQKEETGENPLLEIR